MKGLFFIEAPFQLLSAFEAIEDYQLSDYKIIIRLSNIRNNDVQLKTLVNILFQDNQKIVFHTINVHNRNLKDYLLTFYLLIYSFIFQAKYNHIFIGNLDSGILSLIVKAIKRSKIVLLDDGIKSITFQKTFNKTYKFNLYTMLQGLSPLPNQIIKYNHFIKFKRLLKNIIYKDEIFLIGSKLSESGIISEDYYLKSVEEIAKRHNKYPIKYIIHRGEDPKKLKKISLIQNINIMQLDYPIEFFPIYNKYSPIMIISFYSASLISLKKLYPKINALSYKINYTNIDYRDKIDQVYQYISQYIDVIDLDT